MAKFNASSLRSLSSSTITTSLRTHYLTNQLRMGNRIHITSAFDLRLYVSPELATPGVLGTV